MRCNGCNQWMIGYGLLVLSDYVGFLWFPSGFLKMPTKKGAPRGVGPSRGVSPVSSDFLTARQKHAAPLGVHQRGGVRKDGTGKRVACGDYPRLSSIREASSAVKLDGICDAVGPVVTILGGT